MRSLVALLSLVLVTTASARNVGFADIDYFVKTRIIDGKNAEEYELEFWWCQVGRDDLEKRECVPLSSCRYDHNVLAAEVRKLAVGDLRDELELAVTSSYQTKIKAKEYLPELLKVLATASAKRECILVRQIDVHADRKATLRFDYPELKHGR